ncbi:dynamin family protein [Halonatronum saccharophilum]|uniref:dynamin family protein n=1 Tax=Halonatronum saccharophilum TaxID=150060 RepID=UPI000481488E|nr:dynamin family protein [Halonatronum saccharophilum]
MENSSTIRSLLKGNDSQVNYNVLVLATMSSGKSTLINSIIGKDLLPSENRACTSKFIRITEDNEIEKFEGYAYYNGKSIFEDNEIKPDKVKEWNEDKSIDTIHLKGPLPFIKNSFSRVNLIDSPGPNNSRDRLHMERVDDILSLSNLNLIIYIIDVSQLATSDDRELLDKLNNKLKGNKKTDVLFVLNKTDKLDIETGEDIKDIVLKVKKYLAESGFEEPNLIVLSAYAANLFRKVLNDESLSSKENIDYRFFYDIFSDQRYNLNKFSILNNLFDKKIREEAQNKKLKVGFLFNLFNSFLSSLVAKIRGEKNRKEIIFRLENTGIFQLEGFINQSIKLKE